jgi:hypothetical protein
MEYTIKTISSKSEIDSCPQFQVDKYNWGGDYRPETFGALAFIPGTGFYVKMTCKEKNPTANYTQPMDPVKYDSTMEAFFQFYPEEFPTTYLNFEANSKGAMYAKYGAGRKDRKPYPASLYEACACTGTVYEDYWTLEITIPLELIDFVYGKSDFKSGDTITCNFFKIKESEGMTHFGSFTVIENETPNFHLPQFFAKATID